MYIATQIQRTYAMVGHIESIKLTVSNSSRTSICGLRQSLRSRSGTRRRNDFLAQRFPENLTHVVDKNKPNIFEGLLRHLVEIPPVLLRQEDRSDARTSCCKHLLFH